MSDPLDEFVADWEAGWSKPNLVREAARRIGDVVRAGGGTARWHAEPMRLSTLAYAAGFTAWVYRGNPADVADAEFASSLFDTGMIAPGDTLLVSSPAHVAQFVVLAGNRLVMVWETKT